MRAGLRTIVVAAATAVLVSAVLAEAGGAGIPSPDASIAKRRSGPYAGGDVYTEDCPNADQQVTKTVPRGQKRSVWIRIQNEGGGGRLAFFGEKSPITMRFRYFHGSDDITHEAQTPDLGYDFHAGAHSAERVRWRIKVPPGAPLGEHAPFCSGAGNLGFSITDVVQLTVNVVS